MFAQGQCARREETAGEPATYRLHIGLSGSSAHITRQLAAPLLLLSVVAPLRAPRRGGSLLLRRCLRLCEGREYFPCAAYLVCRPVAVPAGYPSGAPRASLVCLCPSSSTRFATPFDCAPTAQPGERGIRPRAPQDLARLRRLWVHCRTSSPCVREGHFAYTRHACHLAHAGQRWRRLPCTRPSSLRPRHGFPGTQWGLIPAGSAA